jgi:hypothetical protein
VVGRGLGKALAGRWIGPADPADHDQFRLEPVIGGLSRN